ncbi:hypothetical protein [Herbaspirillum sp. YR522]|uniref:hypothetical protein n=1 Tax=Herbaspirillum sp. YR522 TaxID=1144342 RepID=UPI00026FA28C|nr:hypothetical protein [Herbaspirillum sp. YR522]EJN06446.1 hypothetical protein PMI40_02232 [Herbaspirillum sp. YR522]
MTVNKNPALDAFPYTWSPEKLWAVHILGPDDVYAAPTMTDAYEEAARFQRFWAARQKSEYSPTIVAVVTEWNGTPEQHAHSVATYWQDFAMHDTPTAIRSAGLAEDDIDMVSMALRKSYLYGQTYWRQADSDSISQNKKSDETEAKHDKLVDDIRAKLAALRFDAPTAAEVRRPLDVDALANEIRRVDGNHKLGAGALAEALMPYLLSATGAAEVIMFPNDGSQPEDTAHLECPACSGSGHIDDYNSSAAEVRREALDITVRQLRMIMAAYDPDGALNDEEQDTEVSIQMGDETSHSGKGLYAWLSDYPGEGAIALFDTPDDEDLQSTPATAGEGDAS